MNESNIIKAHECCADTSCDSCDDCPLFGTDNCISVLSRTTITYIDSLEDTKTTLESEVDTLKIKNEVLKQKYNTVKRLINAIYKEIVTNQTYSMEFDENVVKLSILDDVLENIRVFKHPEFQHFLDRFCKMEGDNK